MTEGRGDDSPDLSLLHDGSVAGSHAGHVHFVVPQKKPYHTQSKPDDRSDGRQSQVALSQW